MNRKPCTEAQLEEQAETLFKGDLVKLHIYLEELLETTVWHVGKAHIRADLAELKIMIRHDMFLKGPA